jgi:hypothetical protein
VALSALLWSGPAGAASYTLGPPCGQKPITSPSGVGILILFASNGAVQRYQVTAHADNPEAVNDTMTSLEGTYGPASVNAPPVKIVSFKVVQGSTMQIPDKAIDSCGRTLDFN